MLKEGQVRIPSGCAISGVFARDGRPISGEVDPSFHRGDA